MVSDCQIVMRDRCYTQINRIEQDPGTRGPCCYVSEPVTEMSAPDTSVVFPDSTLTGVDNFAYPNREKVTP
jgi:hypothetical protein